MEDRARRNCVGLADWLAEGSGTHVGLESTGEFWKPVFNLLEAAFEVWLLNAQQSKAVPGHKTDVKDAQWILPRMSLATAPNLILAPSSTFCSQFENDCAMFIASREVKRWT